jgi:hypothetical protein
VVTELVSCGLTLPNKRPLHDDVSVTDERRPDVIKKPGHYQRVKGRLQCIQKPLREFSDHI